MKIHRGKEYIHIDLSGAEAAVLLEELETVRGGAKCVKLKQMCEGIRQSLVLDALMKPAKRGRPKVVAINSQRSSPFEIETTAPWAAEESDESK